MDPYEDIKKRMLPPKPEKDKKECKTCKKKLAQEQFDMIANGSSYIPQMSLVRPGPDVIEVMWGNGGTTQTQPTTTAKKYDALDELYGGRLAATKPFDAIGELYGGKLPQPRKVDAIGELYGENKQSYGPGTTYPCLSNEFPNNNKFIKNYLPTTPINRNCKLFFHVDDPKNTISYPININVNSCCSKFTKNLWCEGYNIELIKKHYFEFYRCLAEIFKKVLIKFIKLHPDLTEIAIEQFMDQFKEIQNSIFNDRDVFIKKSPDERSTYAGYHSDYCLCSNDSSGFPTFCCDPYYEDDETKRPECWCNNKFLKNLCEDCEESYFTVDFWLDHWLRRYDDYNWDCHDEHRNGNIYDYADRGKPVEIKCVVTDENGYEIDSFQWSDIMTLEYRDPNTIDPILIDKLNEERAKEGKTPIDINADRVFPIRLKKDIKQTIDLWIYLPCGDCCWFDEAHTIRDEKSKMVVHRQAIFDPSDPIYKDKDFFTILGLYPFEQSFVEEGSFGCQKLC